MAVDQLYFRNRPDASLGGLQRDLFEYTQRLRDFLRGLTPRLLERQTIGTSETKVAHGLAFTPARWSVFNQEGAGIVYQTRAPDDRYLYLAAQTTFGSAAGAPAEIFVRNDMYYCAGIFRPAGPADENARTESNGSGAPTAGFDTHILAVPEVIKVDCVVNSLGFWTDATVAGALHAYAAVCNNVDDGAGNDYPGSVLGLFEWISVGFLGASFRNGAVSVPLVAGQKVWFITATNNANPLRGYRQSTDYRAILGESTPFNLVNQRNHMGIRSGTAPAYNAGITAFPAGGVLCPIGNDTLAAAAGNTTLRPSVYYKMTVTSAAAANAAGSLVCGLEVF